MTAEFDAEAKREAFRQLRELEESLNADDYYRPMTSEQRRWAAIQELADLLPPTDSDL